SVGDIKKWSIKKADGNRFQFRGIYLRDSGQGANTSGTITPRDADGNAIGDPVTVDFDGTYNTSFIVNSDFWQVSEVTIEGDDLNLFVDQFTYGPPLSVAADDPAQVLGISLQGSPLTTATSVTYNVAFSKAASNVDVADFVLTTSGSVTA